MPPSTSMCMCRRVIPILTSRRRRSQLIPAGSHTPRPVRRLFILELYPCNSHTQSHPASRQVRITTCAWTRLARAFARGTRHLFQTFFGFWCLFCFVLTSCCSHTARTAAAAGTTFRGNGPYARIIGCASCFSSDADAHADAAVMCCAFSVSSASRSLLQKKKHPGVAIPIPAHILPTDCQNDKSCKNTVSFPGSIFRAAAAKRRLHRRFLCYMTILAGVRFPALKPRR